METERNIFRTRLRNRANFLSHLQSKRVLNGLCSVEEFCAILKRERGRSDRTGERFSLVVFDVDGTDTDLNAARRLIEVLTQRLRSTDELGWFDTRCVGAVLPNTSAESARRLASDISYESPVGKPIPAFEVYAYPSEWLPGSKENPPNPSSTKSDSDGSAPSATQYDKNKACNYTSIKGGIEPFLCRGIPVWKRIIDIIGSVIGLILLFPLFLCSAIIIKVVSPGPVVFKQKRIGYLGTPFFMWKFRTMRVDADPLEHQEHLSNLIRGDAVLTKLDENVDPRIIPFGRFLRYLGVDELPQLINVIRGEMSLIGPRPCCPYEAQEYLLWQRNRFNTMPGLTGLWQVSGKNNTTFKEMMRLDIKYSEQRSFWLDLKILLKTVPAIIAQAIQGGLKRKEEEHAKGH